jgi:hypothetical protein
MNVHALLAGEAACTLVAGYTSTSTTRVVEPAPATTTVVQPYPAATTQRTVYPDGTYRDTTTTVAPAGTTTVYR